MASLAGGGLALDSFGPDIIGELEAGRTFRLDDVGTDRRSAPCADAYAAIGTRSLIVVPLLKHGGLQAILYLHCAGSRFWTGADAAIAEDAAHRIGDAIERAEAGRELQSERVRLRAVVDTIPAGLIMMDEDGRLLIENDEWKRTWGGNAHLDGGIDYQRYQGSWADTGEPVAPEQWAMPGVSERRPCHTRRRHRHRPLQRYPGHHRRFQCRDPRRQRACRRRRRGKHGHHGTQGGPDAIAGGRPGSGRHPACKPLLTPRRCRPHPSIRAS